MAKSREELQGEFNLLLKEYNGRRANFKQLRQAEGFIHHREFGLILNAADQVYGLTEREFEGANEFKQILLLRVMQSLNNKLDYVVSFAERIKVTPGQEYELSRFYEGVRSEFDSLLHEAEPLEDPAYLRVLKGFFNTFSRMVEQMRGRTQGYATKEQITSEQDEYVLVRHGFKNVLDEYALQHKDNDSMMMLHRVAENLLSHANKVSESSLKDNHEVMALMNRDLDDAQKIIRSADESRIQESIETINRMMNRRSFQTEDRTWSEYVRAKLTFRNVAIAATLCAVAGAVIFFTGGAGIPLVAPLCAYGPVLMSTAAAGISGLAISTSAQAAFALTWMVNALNPITAIAFLQQSGFGYSTLGQVGAGLVYGVTAALAAAATLFAGGYGASKVLGWAYNLVAGREPDAKEGMMRADDPSLRDEPSNGVFSLGDPGSSVFEEDQVESPEASEPQDASVGVSSDLSHEDEASHGVFSVEPGALTVVSVKNPIREFKKKLEAERPASPEADQQVVENPLRTGKP